MGLSLRGIGRRITDIFDANSAQDQAKRVAAGQAQMYEQQQANRGVAGRSIASNPIQRVVNTGRALGEGIIEAPRQLNNWAVTTMQQGTTDYINAQKAQLGLQNTQAQIAASQGQILRNPMSTPVQRQNAVRLLNQNSQGMSDTYGGIKEQQNRDTMALDPVRNAAAGASVVFDLATLGTGSNAKVALKEGFKQGKKQFAKVAFREGSKTAATGAVSGGLSPIVAKGKDATLKDVLTSAAGGAVIGGLTPVGMYGASRVMNKVANNGPVPNLLRDKGIMRPSVLSDTEVGDLARFKQQTGGMMDDGVYERGIAAAQKAGIDIRPTSSDADNLIKAHQTYNVRKMQPRGETGGGFLGNEPTIKNMLGEDVPNPNYAPQVGKTDKPKVGLKKNEKDLLARVAYTEAADKAAKLDAQNTVNKIREKAFKEGNRNLTKNEMIKEALAMEKLTGVKPEGPPKAPSTTKPKVIKYPPVGEITEAPKTPGAFQRSVRSIKGVLKQYGETGKDAVKRLEGARNNKEISTQAFLDKTRAVWDLDDSETIQFFQSLKKLSNGEQPNMSDRVSKAVQEWSDNIPSVRERAVAAGIEVGDQGKFYAPQTHSNLKGDGEIKFINQMIAEGKATDIADARTKLQFMKNDNYKPFGSLEKSREVDMPGYDMTRKALSDYVARAHDTIATAEQFGPKGEGKMEILARLQQEGYNSSQIDKAEEYLDKALKLKQYDKTLTQASSAVRQANAFMTLGTAGVSNAGQVTNTMTVAGIGRTLKNMAKVMTSKTSRAQADSMGVTLDHAISTIESQQVGTQNRILRNIASPLFREVERFNRRYTALVGEDFGNHLLKKGEFGTRKLQELGVTGEIGEKLTPNQVQQLSRGLVETTQFKVDPMDLPAWTDSPMGKVVSQYKPFIYKQTEFMYHQVIKEAGKGNFAPLLRFLTVGVPIGLGGQKIKDTIKGRDSFKDEEGNKKSFPALVDKGIASVGGYGMADNARFLAGNAGSERLPQYVASSFGGPTAGNIVETAINVSKAAGKNKDMKPLGRQVLSKIPTVGPKVANTVLPYDKKESSAPKNGEAATPAQLDKQSSEEMKKLKENVKVGDNSLVQLPNGTYAVTINGEVTTKKTLEEARHAARMDHALADGSESKVLGEKGKEIYYYKNENGETKSMPNYRHEFDVIDSQNQLDMYVAKDNEDYKGWTVAASSQLKALETLRDKYNKDSQEDKVDDIQKKIETLKSSMRKYASYGGAFTKGKGAGSAGTAGQYHVSLNAGGSAPRVTSVTNAGQNKMSVSFKNGSSKPRVTSKKSRV